MSEVRIVVLIPPATAPGAGISYVGADGAGALTTLSHPQEVPDAIGLPQRMQNFEGAAAGAHAGAGSEYASGAGGVYASGAGSA